MSNNLTESDLRAMCLLHENSDCSCNIPVTDRGTLMYRLRRSIATNETLMRQSKNPVFVEQLISQNAELQRRLDEAKNIP